MSKGQEGFDKLFKIRPLLNLLNELFATSFNPPRNLSVDEMMVAFKGRSSLKQYIANKPIKRGFRLWSLCSSDGYVLNFDVYVGAVDVEQEDSLGSRVVLSLMKGFNQKGHVVFADRFFSSPALAEELLEYGTFFTGTLKKGRKGFPKTLEPVPRRGDYSWRMKENGLLAGIWKDSKDVPFISTSEPPVSNPMPTCRRRIKNQIATLPIPPAIRTYNANKAGVDIADQRRSYCHLRIKQLRRWWLPLFLAFLDITLENSRFLWNWGKANKDVLTSKTFRLQLVEELTKDQKKPPIPTMDASLGHFPRRSTSSNKRCKRCYSLQNERRTVMECCICKEHGIPVGLCLDCFGPYHLEKIPS